MQLNFLQFNNPQLLQTLNNITLISFCNGSELYPGSDETVLLDQALLPVFGLSAVTENDQCSEAVSQFFCNVVGAVDNDIYKECLEARDDKCAAEWRIIESFFNATLLSCDSFNGSGNFIIERAPKLSCPDDFGIFCGSLCQPLCADISLFDDAATVTYEVLNIILHTTSIIAGVITIIACFMRRTKM